MFPWIIRRDTGASLFANKTRSVRRCRKFERPLKSTYPRTTSQASFFAKQKLDFTKKNDFPGTIVTSFFHDSRTMTSYNSKPISRNRKWNFLSPRWNIAVAQLDYKTINYFTGIIRRKLKVKLTGFLLKRKLGGNKVTLSYADRLTLIYDLNLIAQNCSSSWNNWDFCTNWF